MHQPSQLAGEPFPLYWPEGTPRTQVRKRSPYKATSVVTTFEEIRRRLSRAKATQVVISTNVQLRRDGLPVAGGSSVQIQDPGVAVYFTRRERDSCLACDAWLTVGENLRAIANTLRALATIEASGSASLADAAFAGFARLPSNAGPSSRGFVHWTKVLGITRPWSNLAPHLRAELRAEVERVYRELSRSQHPDRGGTDVGMAELNRAHEEALRDIG